LWLHDLAERRAALEAGYAERGVAQDAFTAAKHGAALKDSVAAEHRASMGAAATAQCVVGAYGLII
jgi:hypothetical protein